MFSLKNRAFRIVLSLFMGGMIQEFFHISTGRDFSGWLWIGAIVSYISLSVWIYYKNLNDVNQLVKKEEEKKANSSLLDN